MCISQNPQRLLLSPLDINHRGLSGTNQINVICMILGNAWTKLGALHAQSLRILFVPYVNHAATMLPKYHVAVFIIQQTRAPDSDETGRGE
jgi:hypothetical protein